MPSCEEHSEYRYGIWLILVDTDTIRTDRPIYPIPGTGIVRSVISLLPPVSESRVKVNPV